MRSLRPLMLQMTEAARRTITSVHVSFAPLMFADYRQHWRRCTLCRVSLRRGTVPPMKVNGAEYTRRRRRRNRR